MHAVFAAFMALFLRCDDVYYITEKGRNAFLVLIFNKSASFFDWQDYYLDVHFPFEYVRRLDDSVVVYFHLETLFKNLATPAKWHVNNRGLSSIAGI